MNDAARRIDRALAVDGLAQRIDGAAQHRRADRHRDGRSGVEDGLPQRQAFCGGKRDATHSAVTQERNHFQRNGLFALHVAQRMDGRGSIKLDVYHRADHGHERTLVHERSSPVNMPPMISLSSWVMEPWRTRLYSRRSLAIISSALRVALSMAAIRAHCSLAKDWISVA